MDIDGYALASLRLGAGGEPARRSANLWRDDIQELLIEPREEKFLSYRHRTMRPWAMLILIVASNPSLPAL